jgi:hypothetical protein
MHDRIVGSVITLTFHNFRRPPNRVALAANSTQLQPADYNIR